MIRTRVNEGLQIAAGIAFVLGICLGATTGPVHLDELPMLREIGKEIAQHAAHYAMALAIAGIALTITISSRLAEPRWYVAAWAIEALALFACGYIAAGIALM